MISKKYIKEKLKKKKRRKTMERKIKIYYKKPEYSQCNKTSTKFQSALAKVMPMSNLLSIRTSVKHSRENFG